MGNTSGLIMAIVGFIMILINAIGYLFDFDITSPAMGIMGLVFVAVGMGMVRRTKK